MHMVFTFTITLQKFREIRRAALIYDSDKVSHRGMEGTEDCKKQSNGSHGGIVGAWSNRDSLPILLAIYM
ncbi:MAG: hypothetical protein HXO38_06040 [Prevotella sp.]|nr:hypothetical protein [Prevotella sp.]